VKALLLGALAVAAMLSGLSLATSAEKNDAAVLSDREKLVGAWRLVSLEAPRPDGKMNRIPDLLGMLIYTRDGHMSVQLMYPKSASNLTNDYVKNGYEASFGSYDVDETAHTVTHHVQGSITEGLIGKDLPRAFEFSAARLIIKSTRPDERWSVIWEHY
jgi:Lipocalin-like domain